MISVTDELLNRYIIAVIISLIETEIEIELTVIFRSKIFL